MTEVVLVQDAEGPIAYGSRRFSSKPSNKREAGKLYGRLGNRGGDTVCFEFTDTEQASHETEARFVNTSERAINAGRLARLLVRKGIITQEELDAETAWA